MDAISQKLRLLFVVGAYPPADKEGGPGLMIKALSKYLYSHNCTIQVSTTNKNGNEKITFNNETVEDSYAEVFYGDCNRPLFPYHSMPMIKHTAAVMDNVDFVFISSSWNLYGVITGYLARRKRKPYAVYSHGSYHPVRLDKSRLKKALWWFLFDKWLYKNAKFVIAMSENERLQVKSYGVDSEVIVLPIGIDNTLMESNYTNPDPNPPMVAPGQKYILFLSRISEIKNLEYTFDYFADFLIDNDLMLLVAGGGDPAFINEVERYLDNHIAKNHIKLLGVVSGSEKRHLLENAQFFTLLSKAEGLPQSVLEAMHFGVPVIASNECNLLDAIECEVVLCDSDSDTLNIMADLLGNQERYERFSKKTLAYAKEHFDWQSISIKYLEHINRSI